jgi:hypothetical protein
VGRQGVCRARIGHVAAIVADWATGVVLRVGLTRAGDADVTVLVGDWGTGTIYRIAAA